MAQPAVAAGDNKVGPTDPMVHITVEPPGTHGLCGTKLIGVDAPDHPIDCVVCVQMAKAMGVEY